jgi:A/G-specific adenine glycosylase
MMEQSNFFAISNTLQHWYEKNKRELPWRETNDPYIIWISEVILQQTRVNQGYDYFVRFIRRFPNIKALAEASEEDVLKQWQGLGYYSRARNLHAAAKQIEECFHGEFPKKYPDILSLKGVGEYTAAAIMSIAYRAPFAVIDGNVLRVISRLFMIDEPVDTARGKKTIAEIAQTILDPQHPDIHNQAIMDFGATLCKPKQPKCAECPLQAHCLAFAKNAVSKYPVKNKSTKTTKRYFHYFHIVYNNHTYIRKREANDIWKNLYEFPLIETPTSSTFPELQNTEAFCRIFKENRSIVFTHKLHIKHMLSHQIIYTDFYEAKIPASENFSLSNEFQKIPIDNISDFPVSRLIHKYLEKF